MKRPALNTIATIPATGAKVRIKSYNNTDKTVQVEGLTYGIKSIRSFEEMGITE